jgi:hypothetical protein
MKEVVKDFLLQSVERNGVVGISTYSVGFSIVDYFLEQWELIKIRLVNTIEDSVETNEEVSNREKPDVVFDKYGRWVKLIGKRVNDGFGNGSGGEETLCP